MYVLKTSIKIPAMVPFYTDWNESITSDLQASFPEMMAKAALSSR